MSRRGGSGKSLGKRKNPRKDEREQAFKRAALKFFSAKGYHRTTMSEIALEAGFGKGTLYWYWKSKEDLYFALIEDMHREFLDLVERAVEMEGSAWDKLRWLGREVIDLYYRDRDYCKLSWKMRAEELETFSPEHVERLYAYIDRTKAKLQELVAQGVEEGLFPPYDPYYLACMLLGLVEGMEIQWLEDSQSFDLRRAMDMAMNLLSILTTGREWKAVGGSGGINAGGETAATRSDDGGKRRKKASGGRETVRKGGR